MRIEDGRGQPFVSEYGGAVTLPMDHYIVHEGMLYTAEHSASVNNAASMEILIKTGANELHTDMAINAGGAATVYLFEGPTMDVGGEPEAPLYGTEITPVCQNRISAAGIVTTFYHTPTTTADGDALINGRLIPGGTNVQTRVGNSARVNAEWLLAPNTIYLLRITNTSGGAVVINPVIQAYER